MAEMSIQEVAERTRKHIGETFPYFSQHEYPYGLMKQATLKAVTVDDWNGHATIEVTFTDGFKADYNTLLAPFYEDVIINIENALTNQTTKQPND